MCLFVIFVFFISVYQLKKPTMKKLLIFNLTLFLLLTWCKSWWGDNTTALQKQIDDIKNLPTIKKEIEEKIVSDNQEPFKAIVVSNDVWISSKIDQIKQNIFKKMEYEVVTSDSAKWKELINKFWAKYLPLLVTWEEVKQTEIKDFLAQLAVEKEWQFNIDLAWIAGQMRIEINKTYLQTPKFLDYDWVKWPADAKVVMIEFSDFECPFCKKFYEEGYKQIMDKYWDKIQVRFKHLPLAFHSKAKKAAEAAQCARRQNKFWEMHDKLFENQTSLSIENYKLWAKEFWLDSWAFDKCLDSWETTAEVEFLAKQAWSFWVAWTPWVFINNQFVSWAYPFDTFDKMISEELAK